MEIRILTMFCVGLVANSYAEIRMQKFVDNRFNDTVETLYCKDKAIGTTFKFFDKGNQQHDAFVVGNNNIKNQLKNHPEQIICTSHVTDMEYLFAPLATSNDYGILPKNLKYWDTSSVTSMKGMFTMDDRSYGIPSSEQDALKFWDVSNVRNMEAMFSYSNFNGDISRWKTDELINIKQMFEGAYKFNQNLSSWNTINCSEYKDYDTNAFAWEKNNHLQLK